MSTAPVPLPLPAALLAAGVALVFTALAFIHVYWSLGGRRGALIAIPQKADGAPVFTPSPIATQAVAFLLIFAAHLVSGRIAPTLQLLPAWAYFSGPWLLFAVFTLRVIGDFRLVGLFKRERSTVFARYDTRLFTPLCLLLAAALLIVARS